MQKPNSGDEFEMDDNDKENDHDIDNDSDIEEDDNRFLDTTCLVPEEPQTNLVVNRWLKCETYQVELTWGGPPSERIIIIKIERGRRKK